jgi:uroporphyrinogen decarboxylase
MTGRERILRALAFEPVDRVPKDLGGMRSTGVSAFAYPRLAEALGLPARAPRIHDTGQMLALPDVDVLDALGCDAVVVEGDACTSAFDEPGRWHPYDFGGRLPARVMDPARFAVGEDGVVAQDNVSLMVPGSYVFDGPHAGQILDLSGDLKKEDLDALQRQLRESLLEPARIAAIRDYCRRVRESTSRAVFYAGLSAGLGFRGGIPNFSMLCVAEPEYVHALHGIFIGHAVAQAERLLPAIAPYVDVLMLSADDQGIQTGTILPPPVFRSLFGPY